MNNGALTALKILMWCVCAFHLAVGAGVNLSSEDFPKTVAQYYGADKIAWTPQFVYLLKPIGAFMLALGVIAAAAAMRPLDYRPAIYAFVMLFVIRAVQRLVYADVLLEDFGIPQARNVSNMVFFFGLAAALVVCERMATKKRAALGAG